MSSTSSNRVMQFKISLKNLKPEVYRRVLVPIDYTFRDLHFVIQDVFGWSNMHLHKYNVYNKKTRQIEIEIGTEDVEAYTKFFPERTTKLTEIFKRAEDKCEYEYDFGSPWYHIVLLEDILSGERGLEYPCCIGGNRRTPPEDCPGEDYDEFSEGWDHFDPSEVVFRNKSEKVDLLDDMVPPAVKRESEDPIQMLMRLSGNSSIPAYSHLYERLNEGGSSSSEGEATAEQGTSAQGSSKRQNEDMEETYGKYVATQMRLVEDEKKREELRIDIQKVIKKHRFGIE